jgi:hypothetical protein
MTILRKTSGQAPSAPALDPARLAGFSLAADGGADPSVTGLKMGSKDNGPIGTVLGSIGEDFLTDRSAT